MSLYFAGLDIGSTMTKVVIIDEEGKILAYSVSNTGAEHRRLANKVMEETLLDAGLTFEQISYIIATGYGRFNVPFADQQISELSCHARGISKLLPSVRTVIDIGGQDAKGLKLSEGKLVDFVMNDKCAAGTGRFLEVIAAALGLKMEDLGKLSLKSTSRVMISNTCTIFARQEVVARLSEGVKLENIVAGLHYAIASRVATMVRKLRPEPDIVFTGGVAKNIGVVKAMEENMGQKIFVPEEPLLSGALGAAMLGWELFSKAVAKGEPIQKKKRHLEEVTFYA